MSADQPAAAVPAPPGVAEQDDWLDRICPYLLSEDGTYRSTEPDAAHRCTAQDPPGSLPIAFQERFCLSDRHVRCEMYKFAQSTHDDVPAEQVKSARFKPSVRSVPLALGPSDGAGSGGGKRRSLIILAAAIGALLVIVLLVTVLFGGGGSTTAPAASPSAAPGVTQEPASTKQPTPRPTLRSQPTASPQAGESTIGPRPEPLEIRYEVQEGEALLKISDTFGVTRRRIIRANEGMADKTPYVVAGDVIIVPVSPDMTIDEIEAIPGYLSVVE